MVFYHSNYNVKDIEKEAKFYEEVMGLKRGDSYDVDDGALKLQFMVDERGMQMELTCINFDKITEANEFYIQQKFLDIPAEQYPFHIAFYSHDYENDLKKHQEMGIVVDVEEEANVYFIKDPEGNLLEIGNGQLYDEIYLKNNKED